MEYLSITQFADRLGIKISRQAILNRIKKDEIKARKFPAPVGREGFFYRIPASELKNWKTLRTKTSRSPKLAQKHEK